MFPSLLLLLIPFCSLYTQATGSIALRKGDGSLRVSGRGMECQGMSTTSKAFAFPPITSSGRVRGKRGREDTLSMLPIAAIDYRMKQGSLLAVDLAPGLELLGSAGVGATGGNATPRGGSCILIWQVERSLGSRSPKSCHRRSQSGRRSGRLSLVAVLQLRKRDPRAPTTPSSRLEQVISSYGAASPSRLGFFTL